MTGPLAGESVTNIAYHTRRRKDNIRICRSGRPPRRSHVLWHGAALHDPLHWLSGHPGDEIVVAVVVQQRDTFPFGDCGDQQVREADGPDPSGAPQRGLHVQCTMPVLIMGGQPLIARVPVRPDLVELSARARRPAELKLDDTAGCDQPGLDERA